jgi:two-component system CheB/CheR fusion protein
MAFVLVQHLAPDQKSLLVDLIKYRTHMEVLAVEDQMKVRRDCVYVIPPDRNLALEDGALRLSKPKAGRGLRLPVDFFFRSLAQELHEHAMCVVLSGAGCDGTLGLREVKGRGGAGHGAAT